MDKISIRNARFAKPGLHDLCNYINTIVSTKDKTIVEIGSYVGDSTEIFAQYFKKVICIDPWKNGYDDRDAASFQHPMNIIESQFNELMKKYPNIEKRKGYSLERVNEFNDNSIFAVYIDGLHTYEGAKNDILAWYPKVIDSGFVLGHDYKSKHHPGVQKAVEELIPIEVKRFNDSSWLVKKSDFKGLNK